MASDDQGLFTIQFYDQLFIHRQLDVFAFRQRNHAPLIVLAIDFEPHRCGQFFAARVPKVLVRLQRAFAPGRSPHPAPAHTD